LKIKIRQGFEILKDYFIRFMDCNGAYVLAAILFGVLVLTGLSRIEDAGPARVTSCVEPVFLAKVKITGHYIYECQDGTVIESAYELR